MLSLVVVVVGLLICVTSKFAANSISLEMALQQIANRANQAIAASALSPGATPPVSSLHS